jgi:hypothetical protein
MGLKVIKGSNHFQEDGEGAKLAIGAIEFGDSTLVRLCVAPSPYKARTYQYGNDCSTFRPLPLHSEP